MANLTRDFFIGLSNNKILNKHAKKWGFRLGAEKFVAGTNIESVTEIVKELNQEGISATLDNLGEFVADKSEATMAKDDIIQILDIIHHENLDCHISLKLTQLGLDIDIEFCIENMKEILDKASEYDIFINIDMEKYIHYEKTLDVLHTVLKEYSNVGTVIQSYLYRVAEDLEQLKDVRIRLVKGAYKESEAVAYQSKDDIDRNFIEMAKKRLLKDTFTSIATHDHHIINELKQFIEGNKISRDNFEFQMLYGFRTEMHYSLKEEGYNFCTYIPFGDDWFGYFMRRLAERPQNMNLILKDVLYTKENKLKKRPIAVGALAISAIGLLSICNKKKKS
ncbi:proline dehydrogenase [Virgibacillus profundi]|uniref:proline dehydrogenase n=1 Tax=Virgibacillus profundi TaxID=2024555 RepID=A0A2A2IBB5_9BACI|nr:proline dehydrogenase family protein [Virgibacillus profundi]PAV28862.1 proline dehydrogenase [Virgibacillus profundi]PXY53030.1 proline dehydrogenase [Virgibacillus profundi]